MPVEPLIGLRYQLPIETLFTSARFITRNEKDSTPFRVESESNAPNAIISIESQLLHVRVAGAFQGIDPGPPELRTKLFEQSGVGKHFVLHRF